MTTARDRWLAATAAERASGVWCAPRRPVPRSCPWALTGDQEQAILDARAKSNWGPMRLTWLTGRHRSTCWKVLHRHGVSRRRRGERRTHRRYEWADAGALLHIDALRLAKFDRPGHWATGQRAEEHKTRQAGKTVVIGVLDDHTRLTYCELHADENAATVTATLRRAARWFRDQGCGPVQAVMSDNHKAYTSLAFTGLLSELGARHILTPAYTPRWNGKICVLASRVPSEWAARLPASGGLTQAKDMSGDGGPAREGCWPERAGPAVPVTCVRFVGRRAAGGPAMLT